MLFSKLKEIVTTKLKGDVDVSTLTNDEWLVKLDEALSQVTTDAIPSELKTYASFDVFKVVNGCPIRKWELPTADTDELDIDEELAYAATDYIAFKHAQLDKNIMRYEADFNEKITNYNWNYFSKGDDYE